VVFTSFFLKFVKAPQADIQNCVATPWFFGGYQTVYPPNWHTADMKVVFLRFVINLQKAFLHRAFSSLGVAVRCDSPWHIDMALSC